MKAIIGEKAALYKLSSPRDIVERASEDFPQGTAIEFSVECRCPECSNLYVLVHSSPAIPPGLKCECGYRFTYRSPTV